MAARAMTGSVKILPRAPKGWLVVIILDRCSERALMSSNSALELRRDRCDRRPLRTVLVLVLQHPLHRPLSYLR